MRAPCGSAADPLLHFSQPFFDLIAMFEFVQASFERCGSRSFAHAPTYLQFGLSLPDFAFQSNDCIQNAGDRIYGTFDRLLDLSLCR
jgi:hypothetical protein